MEKFIKVEDDHDSVSAWELAEETAEFIDLCFGGFVTAAVLAFALNEMSQHDQSDPEVARLYEKLDELSHLVHPQGI